MLPKRVQVLKHNQIRINGSVCVSATLQSMPTGPERMRTSLPQQARIVESNSEYAIIEVTCSCGGKSHIQCNYAHVNEGSQT